MKAKTLPPLFLLVFGIIVFSGCSKEETILPEETTEVTTPPTTPPVDTNATQPGDTTATPGEDTTTTQKETVDTVIISRYAGLWYEIATIPQIFQTGCNCTTAEYAATTDPSEISVTNRCNLFNAGGFENNITGKATIVPGSGNAKLLVSFFGFGGADYWVIDLDADYQWAVVGSPTKEFFWILSRTRTMNQNLYQSLIQKWGEAGYDISKVKMTNQSGC